MPKPIEVEYPAMLEFPPPVLRAYPKETVVAEKLEALTTLGMLNSRIKDYYDLSLLARLYPFEGALLIDAIYSTFRHRGTSVETNPVGLREAFSSDPARAVQWRAFVRRSRLDSRWDLEKIVEQVRLFASEPLAASAENRPFNLNWRPGGPCGLPSGGEAPPAVELYLCCPPEAGWKSSPGPPTDSTAAASASST